MATYTRRADAAAAQAVAPFTGEGAYHGSTRPRDAAAAPAAAPAPAAEVAEVAEVAATTLDRYAREGRTEVQGFEARFPNAFEVVASLPPPTQEAIAQEDVTLCWSPWSEAEAVAGSLTRAVLAAMRPHLTGRKRFIYVDSKVQRFEAGDLPVDSDLWHVDGTITARDGRAQRLGLGVAHDMRARLEGAGEPPLYLAYQSSWHCATQYVAGPLTVTLPEVIGGFDTLDRAVRAADPPVVEQPAASVARFDGLSLHRAVRAKATGWRLWVRCVETDREVRPRPEVIACYGKVFRGAP